MVLNKKERDFWHPILTDRERLKKENENLIELLVMALPYVEEGEQFHKPEIRGRDSKKIRAAIGLD